jgi:hypothetical protein
VRASGLSMGGIHPLDVAYTKLLDQRNPAQLDDFALRHIDVRFMRVDGRDYRPPATPEIPETPETR